MFVIITSWKNLNLQNNQVSLPEKIGRTMQHAGTSITVTTVTDITAFLVGSLTVSHTDQYQNELSDSFTNIAHAFMQYK